ncbi:hypothetical protein U9M48_030845, partial [Paspalum notatum var. saurae]
KNDEYHKQRAKKQWVTLGDRNTAFFHKCILKRARKNRIPFIITQDGTTLTTNEQIADCFRCYFTNLFSSQLNDLPPQDQNAESLQGVEPLNDAYTDSTPSTQEIWDIVKNMRNDAAPGPDGFNAAFYKVAWPWIAQDVTRLIVDFYSTGELPQILNRTYITLIPKGTNATSPQNFRPISLCNVIYKIISSSLAKRIKNHQPSYIHASQAAFILGRHIISNIILAQEITHSFSLNTWNQHAFMLKIDLAKAFDRMEWSFILKALQRRGFSNHFCRLIYQCLSTTSFSVIINGQPFHDFRAQRGIRQGCPMSPYLFVIAINELSLTLQEAMNEEAISGISLGHNCPPIHSLMFADDLIVCGQTTQQEVTTIKQIIDSFCTTSGQIPNWSKSSITYSKKVTRKRIPRMNNDTIHLGHPILLSYKNRTIACSFILNKFRSKLTALKADSLSHAGRLVYINSVLASIPIYYMTNILFPKNFFEKINSFLRNFWWKGSQSEGENKTICFRTWEDICQPKYLGGLGIKSISTVNKSLVTHAAWMIAAQREPFLSKVLKAKYHPHTSFWKAPSSGVRSVFWSSIQSVRQYINESCIYQIYEGSVNIWNEPWCPI